MCICTNIHIDLSHYTVAPLQHFIMSFLVSVPKLLLFYIVLLCVFDFTFSSLMRRLKDIINHNTVKVTLFGML